MVAALESGDLRIIACKAIDMMRVKDSQASHYIWNV